MDQGGVLLQQQPLQAASQIGPSSHTYTGFSISDSSRAHLGNQYVSNYYYYDLQYEWKVTDLCYITYNAVHRALQSRRLPGTGTWLLNSDDFRRWRDDDESTTLWWYGSPGAGKTFLASNVIDHLRSLPEDQASPVLYLYASRDRMFEQSTTQYLACLARQLAESYLASLARHVVDSLALTKKRLFLIDVDRHSHAQDAQSVPALLLLLSRLTRHFSKVLIVLDALDEFSEDPNDQHDLLDALASLQAASRCILSMCVTSWQTHQDMAPLRPASALRVHTPDQELKMYIDARIRLSPRLRMFCTKADLHSEVISSVLNKAGNVFKLASLQMDHLAKQRNILALRTALDSLSAQLDFYYEESLRRIDDNQDFGHSVKRLLGWLLFLREPLDSEEFCQVLGMTSNTPRGTEPRDIEIHLSTLIGAAEGLVLNYPADAKPISFAHETIRAFLMSRRNLLGDVDWNANIARTYMQYMALDQCLSTVFLKCSETLLRSFGYVDTSRHTWYRLLSRATSTLTFYQRAATEDISADTGSFAQRLSEEASRDENKVTAFMVCSFYGWPCVIQSLQTKPQPDARVQVYLPSHVAVTTNNKEMVRFMLDNDNLNSSIANERGFGTAPSNRISSTLLPGLISAGYCSPLEESQTREKTFNIMPVEIANGIGWSAHPGTRGAYLNLVARWSTVCMVHKYPQEKPVTFDWTPGDPGYGQVMPDAGLNPNIQGSSQALETEQSRSLLGSTCLHLAVDGQTASSAKHGFSTVQYRIDHSILEFLLAHPAVDVNAVGYAGFTPLHVAIHNVDIQSVYDILQHQDLDVNFSTSVGHALSWTIHRMCFQTYASTPNAAIIASIQHEAPAVDGLVILGRLKDILQALLGRQKIEINAPDQLGFTALGWLRFYRSLTQEDIAAQSIKSSRRKWLDTTISDTASSVSAFHDSLRSRPEIAAHMESVSQLLIDAGAVEPVEKHVTLGHWAAWVCPPPRETFSGKTVVDVSTMEPGEREFVGHVVRLPFTDFGTVADIRNKEEEVEDQGQAVDEDGVDAPVPEGFEVVN